MMSHRNGHWLNTKSNEGGVHSGEPVRVQASRDIKAGEQIYTTYNMCEDCEARLETYGTSDIFRDYGFIEQFPQSWIYDDLDLGFRVDVTEGEVGDDGEPLYHLVEWIDGDPDDDDIEGLERKLKYIVKQQKMLDLDNRSEWPNVPDYEWDQMVKYMDSMVLGIHVALHWNEINNGNHSCVIDGTCTVSMDRYTDLDMMGIQTMMISRFWSGS